MACASMRGADKNEGKEGRKEGRKGRKVTVKYSKMKNIQKEIHIYSKIIKN
jgi:hypothetical protein